MELQEALERIAYLEKENAALKEELEKYRHYKPQGRKVHDDKWMASYQVWLDLYKAGNSIMEIVDQTDISRRTCYRYKTYYEECLKLQKEKEEEKAEQGREAEQDRKAEEKNIENEGKKAAPELTETADY